MIRRKKTELVILVMDVQTIPKGISSSLLDNVPQEHHAKVVAAMIFALHPYIVAIGATDGVL